MSSLNVSALKSIGIHGTNARRSRTSVTYERPHTIPGNRETTNATGTHMHGHKHKHAHTHTLLTQLQKQLRIGDKQRRKLFIYLVKRLPLLF